MIIDCSKNNGVINWSTVKSANSNLEGVYIKATQGVGYVDPMCETNAKQANALDIPIGFYHFASLNSLNVAADATAEANAFSAVLKAMPSQELPPMLDIETDDINLNPMQVLGWITTFRNQMALLGHANLGIYSYVPFFDTHLPVNHNLGDMPLWVAQYKNEEQPTLPKGWTKAWLWQYTDKGSVPGINGYVDLSKH